MISQTSLALSAGEAYCTLTVGGALPPGKVLFELPAFVRDVASTSAGTIDQSTGTVTIATTVRRVTVTLRRAP